MVVWVFISARCGDEPSVEVLQVFENTPSNRDLLGLMSKDSGVNLLREFRGQEDYLNESVSGRTWFKIDDVSYYLKEGKLG